MPPIQTRTFDGAIYSECEFLECTTVLVPWNDRDDVKDKEGVVVVVDDYNGRLAPVVVVDGESHSVREVSRGVLVPSSS